MERFMFATGIECSYPTVQGGKRRDQLAETKHYDHWRQDFELCVELGARIVRYGPPYYRMHAGPHDYDWSFTDEVLPVMRQMGLIPILDLCHFGLPDWAGDFQNADWPDLFADFADAFAERYPWIAYYTPVNEILVCARFSAKEGIWNEQLKSDKAMIRANEIMCRASLLAMERILKRRPEAIFVQSETAEVLFARDPEAQSQVEHQNQLRFITFDCLYGHPIRGDLLLFLMDHGWKREQYEWFMRQGRKLAPHCVIGLDYYDDNERLVHPDGTEESVGPVLGWHEIGKQYFRRYRRPLMLTETNKRDLEKAPDWLWNIWHNVDWLRSEGVPVIGYTWFSLIDQVDWDIQLREIRGHVNRNGLYGIDRTPNPAAQAFKELAERFKTEPLASAFPMAQIYADQASVAPGDGH